MVGSIAVPPLELSQDHMKNAEKLVWRNFNQIISDRASRVILTQFLSHKNTTKVLIWIWEMSHFFRLREKPMKDAKHFGIWNDREESIK